MFHRTANDDFDGMGVLRLDVKSGYEKEEVLTEILGLIIPPSYDMFDCNKIITKVPIYAIERLSAAQNYGFIKSASLMIGTNDHYAYNGYWIIQNG